MNKLASRGVEQESGSDSSIPKHFVSIHCEGELCGVCYRLSLGEYMVQATHKLGEEIAPDDPMRRHNATQYVCCEHFALIVSPETARQWAGCSVAGGAAGERPEQPEGPAKGVVAIP